MSGTMKNPFFVEVCAVQLPENSVFQDPLAAQSHEPRDKENQRTEGDQCDDRDQDNSMQLKVHEVGPMMEDFLAPGASDNGGNGNSYWCEGGRGEAEKTDTAVFIWMRCNQLQIAPRQLQRQECPKKPFPEPETQQKLEN